MTAEQVETIARKAHWVCVGNLSPALMKDPNRDRYWDVMTEEFKEPWREIVRLVAKEIEQLPVMMKAVPDNPAHPQVSGSHGEPDVTTKPGYPDESI